MLELAGRLLALLRAGDAIAVATSIDVIGSAPHPPGTSMAVSAAGTVLGSVSAGCVETDALEACRDVLAGGAPRALRYGFGGAGAGARPGTACGGELDVLVHRAGGAALERELAAAAAGRPAAIGLVVGGPPEALGALVAAGEGAGLEREPGVDATALERLRNAVVAQAGTGRNGLVEVDCGAALLRAFVETAVPAPRLEIVGATDTAVLLATLAAATGWAVTVSDHRPAFAVAGRFPPGTEVVTALAHEHLAVAALDARSAVCLLGHDEDLDPLAVAVALERGAGYVGALGSRGTTARRRERLRLLGVPDRLADRLHAPIGLDLGASTPAETAVAILAELIAARNGATGRPLADLAGPLHRVRRLEGPTSAVQEAPDPVAGHRQLRRA